MPANPERLRRDMEQLWSAASVTFSEWQTMSEFILPRKSNIAQWQTPGGRQTNRMFDSVGPHAVQTLAASLGGTLTSNSQKWFSLVTRQKWLLDEQDVRAWLEEVADRVYLALNQSNFTSEVNEVYTDLAAFGTGALFIDEASPRGANAFGGLQFTALAPGTYVISEGADGRVDTLYRTFPMTVLAAYGRWGDRIGQTLVNLKSQQPYEPITIGHAVYPRTEREASRADRGNKPVASCYFIASRGPGLPGSTGPLTILDEGGFDEFPFAVPRWSKTSGETYGRGPGHTALPDIRSLNAAVKVWLAAGAKAIDPPLLRLNDGVTGTVSLEPASIIDISEAGALAPLESKARFDVAEFMFQRLEGKIRQVYFVDQLELKESPQMTATEAIIRNELMQRLLGPTAGRLHSELLSPTLFRVVAIMARAGQLPPTPDVLLDAASEADIDVEYEGPLARAQRAHDLVAIDRKNAWVTQQLTNGKPEVLDLFDWDEEGREVAKIVGVPANILLGDEQVAQIRQARQQAQAAQAKLQTMMQGAESMGKAAPMIREMKDMQPEMAGAA